jgi:hypothetical protein
MSTTTEQKQAKDAAIELALLLYDIYKKQKQNGKIVSGQNNAQHTKT